MSSAISTDNIGFCEDLFLASRVPDRLLGDAANAKAVLWSLRQCDTRVKANVDRH